MYLFHREKPDVVFHPVPLADEAIAAVGEHDAKRAESIARLEDLESRLDANIRREMEVLASVRTELARERAAATGQAFAVVEKEIDAVLDELEPDLHDQVADEIERNLEDRQPEYDAADDGRKSYDAAVAAKRKRGDKHWPKRASELAAE
jgi:hypothetical protein